MFPNVKEPTISSFPKPEAGFFGGMALECKAMGRKRRDPSVVCHEAERKTVKVGGVKGNRESKCCWSVWLSPDNIIELEFHT